MSRMMSEIHAILTIAYRDVLKFFRVPLRLLGTLAFPLFFVGMLGTSFQLNLGQSVGYNLLTFIFTGVFVQTLFQSTSFGVISLVEERETNFTQEFFVAPISRYSIIFGKILGESLVALLQALALLLFGLLIGIPLTPLRFLLMLPVALCSCLLGASFGLFLLSSFKSQRAVAEVLPFFIFPQLFLAGVFTPMKTLPWYLDVLSYLMPLRYAVDLARNFFYAGQREYPLVVLGHPALNLLVMVALFTVFFLIGTLVFVRSEQNR